MSVRIAERPLAAPRPVQAAALSARTPRGSLLPAEAIPPLAKKAGHGAAFLADACFLAGVPSFLDSCRQEGIPPAVGAWLPFGDPSQADPALKAPAGILCTALDDPGLAALGELSLATLCGRNTPQAPSKELLEGIPLSSLHVTALTLDALKRLEARAQSAGVFRGGSSRPGIQPQEKAMRRAAEKARIPAIGLVPWRSPPDAPRSALATLDAVAAKTTLERELQDLSHVISALPQSELVQLFADAPELLANAGALAFSCRAGAGGTPGQAMEFRLPQSPPGADRTELAWRAHEGLERMLDPQIFQEESSKEKAKARARLRTQYESRLERELQTIGDTGFAAIFLIAAELTQEMRKAGSPPGPGRGSAAGSLVSWALGVTAPDPIAEGLWFERFINPDRVGPPDFDIDVEPSHQQEAQAKLIQLWNGQGPERSAPIAAWAGFRRAAAFRAACRARGIPQPTVNKGLAGLKEADAQGWSERPDDDAGQARTPLRRDPFRGMPASDAGRLSEALGDVPWLTGATNAVSRHPGAIALLPEPVGVRTPRFVAEGEATKAEERGLPPPTPAIQVDHDEAERAGAVKIDVLALSNLTLLKEVRQAVNGPDPWDLPEDPMVHARISQGDTTGVFQLESRGIRRAARALRPRRFEDIRSLIALYRPGPMDSVEAYARRSRGLEAPDPPHPALQGILAETHGIVVYQEQAMACAVEAAGFSAGEADILRKAIGKKIPGEMLALEERFLAGAADRGMEPASARSLWSVLEKHAGYSFNKAHATCYALVSYATAWYREKHPAAFFSALAETGLLRSGADSERRIMDAALAAGRLGIRFEAPDLVSGLGTFRLFVGEDGSQSIIMPPQALKEVGAAAGEILDTAAQRLQRPKTSSGWARRLRKAGLPRGQVETLARAGAFRSLPGKEKALERIAEAWSGSEEDASLFGDEGTEGKERKKASKAKKEEQRKAQEAARLCPAAAIEPLPPQEELARIRWRTGATSSSRISPEAQEDGTPPRRESLIGLVTHVSLRSGPSGDFASIAIGDETGEVEIGLAKGLQEALAGTGPKAATERIQRLCREGSRIVATIESQEGRRPRITGMLEFPKPETLPPVVILQLGSQVPLQIREDIIEEKEGWTEDLRRLSQPFSPGSARLDVAVIKPQQGGWLRRNPQIRVAPSHALARALEAAWPGAACEILGDAVP